jgi:hypothetical protein
MSISALALSNGALLSGCATDLDVEIFIVLLKHPAGELGPVVSDGPIQDLKPVDD